ncbi:type IV pilus modification PilV family protein [Pilimelia columellifera]|uniref:Prepilin-type N-terminal cleavage/methylation domain-containing protein n=1 Tax=Pilimelia columellifera subsp. columellifera TaxID=706583 RepID=A0ABN3NHV3_9ACTN
MLSSRSARPDDGFTLVETMVSLALIGTVMAAVSAFFISGMSGSHGQVQRQVGAQLATDAMERVHSIPVTDIENALTTSFTPRAVVVNGVTFTQRWALCWQPATGGACVTPKPALAAAGALVKVTVSVTWDHPGCPANPTQPPRRTCEQASATLFATAVTEPVLKAA